MLINLNQLIQHIIKTNQVNAYQEKLKHQELLEKLEKKKIEKEKLKEELGKIYNFLAKFI